MEKWKIYTPEGMRDLLYDECFIKRNMENKVRQLFRSYGYYEIETPAVEFYDAFSSEGGLISQETMFKFFDPQGRILVLRPDATIPVARVAATKFSEAEAPLRFSYIGNTYRYNEFGGGRQKEFTAAGIELLGINTPTADAEVIAIAANTVLGLGLESFQIDIGQMGFFRGLIEEAGLSEDKADELRILIDRKDSMGMEEIIDSEGIKGNLKKIIMGLPNMFGNRDIINKAKEFADNDKLITALDNLENVLDILDDYGLGKYISVDLGLLQDLRYYTGIIFKGFTYDIGFPILRGGRYDNLVGKFGKEMPATGFSTGLNMVMTALERQNIPSEKPSIDTIISYEPASLKLAVELCDVLRKQGLTVEMDIASLGIEKLKNYARTKSIGGIINIIDEENLEVHNLLEDRVEKMSMKKLTKGGF